MIGFNSRDHFLSPCRLFSFGYLDWMGTADSEDRSKMIFDADIPSRNAYDAGYLAECE